MGKGVISGHAYHSYVHMPVTQQICQNMLDQLGRLLTLRTNMCVELKLSLN